MSKTLELVSYHLDQNDPTRYPDYVRIAFCDKDGDYDEAPIYRLDETARIISTEWSVDLNEEIVELSCGHILLGPAESFCPKCGARITPCDAA